MAEKAVKRWYAGEGVQFECSPGCIKCCAIPGVVYVFLGEVQRMADYFGLPADRFMEQYLRHHWGDVFELNFPITEPCMFLEETGCSIYEARPTQCRTFPFWPEYIRTLGTWRGLKKMCPGIGVGRHYSKDEIEAIAAEISIGPFLI